MYFFGIYFILFSFLSFICYSQHKRDTDNNTTMMQEGQPDDMHSNADISGWLT